MRGRDCPELGLKPAFALYSDTSPVLKVTSSRNGETEAQKGGRVLPSGKEGTRTQNADPGVLHPRQFLHQELSGQGAQHGKALR